MNLRRSLLGLDSFLTLNGAQAGLGLGFWFFGFRFLDLGFSGHLVGDGLSILGRFHCRLMNLRRSLLGVDSFLAFDDT
jgi:hypothetical protein